MIKKTRMINKLEVVIFLIILLFLFIVILLKNNKRIFIDAVSNKKFDSSISLTEENIKKIIQEVEKAYYYRGIAGQYCSYRRGFVNSPESATSQHTNYTVCSNFAFNVYYEAFGIKVPSITQLIFNYANAYYTYQNITTNDVTEFWITHTDENGNIDKYVDNCGNTKTMDLSTPEGRIAYADKLLTKCGLKTGDILCYGNKATGTGHTMIVYDIEYNNDNTPKDAIFMDAESGGDDYQTTKITKEELLYRSVKKNSTFTEGVIRYRKLKESVGDVSALTTLLDPEAKNPRSYLVVLRPLLREKDENGVYQYTGNYYLGDYNSSNIYTNRTLTEYSVTDNSLQRIQYPDLYIEKTVDVFNNSVVELGDTLTYTIEINNNSESQYNNNMYVVENYDKEKVQNVQLLGENANFGTIDEENATITWNVGKISKKRIIQYSITLKNDYSLLGSKIISTGTVAGISSATITNSIGNNLSNEEKISIKNNLQTILSNSNKPKGVAMIDKIYNDLGYDFKLGADANNNQEVFDITDLIKTRDKITTYVPSNPAVSLNSQNDRYGIVLTNYYSAAHNIYDENNEYKGTEWKRWEGYSNLGSRDQRADTIYMENFQTGDVLVYKNEQTATINKQYLTESGEYYLIFISQEDKITINGDEKYGFIGVNENGSINNIFGNDSAAFTINDLRTLFGKDYYVVLRPSLGFDITPPDVEVTYNNQEYTHDSVSVSITANEAIQDIEGWTRSADGRVLTKEYTNNIEETIIVKDLAGNDSTVTIKIENITNKVAGDLNDNGQLDFGDVIKIYRHIAQGNNVEVATKHPEWKLSDEKIIQGDLNKNGRVDMGDTIKIQRYIAAKNNPEVAQKHPEWLDL